MWRTLSKQGLYQIHILHVQHLQPGDCAMRLEFFRWGSDNCRLLRLILFTDEATYSCEGINNTRNSHWWSEENAHANKFLALLVRYHR
jgi:hypothetical protein